MQGERSRITVLFDDYFLLGNEIFFLVNKIEQNTSQSLISDIFCWQGRVDEKVTGKE